MKELIGIAMLTLFVGTTMVLFGAIIEPWRRK